MLNIRVLQELNQVLENPKKCVIIPHKSPDGDAIGSTTALWKYLTKKNHECHIIAPDSHPEFLNWIPNQQNLYVHQEQPDLCNELISQSDIVFTLDFNDLSRVGNALQEVLENNLNHKKFVMIDHHQQPSDYATITISEPHICSTCELVYHVIEELNDLEKIDSEIATSLYTGIMTDTGSFRFRSTTSTTHRVIADLIDRGADNTHIHEKISDTNTLSRLKLKGIALNNLTVLDEYHTAIITLSQKELNDCNFKKGDTDGFVNIGLSIQGIRFAIICIEDPKKGIIKLSFRSKGDFCVNTFARMHFNGGGHMNAAGGMSKISLDKTFEKILALIPNYTKELC